MITLLIYILILLVIFGIAFYIVDAMPFGQPPLKWAIKALIGLILLLVLLELVVGRIPPAVVLR